MFKPFIINSNIATSLTDVETFDAFMNATACNVGNSYITYSLLKELGVTLRSIKGYEIKNIYTYNFTTESQKDIDTINNECTCIILMLQDQIRIHESYGYRLPFKQLTNFLSQTKCPIIVAGLGANSLDGYRSDFHQLLDDEQVAFWRYLSTRCALIGIRGGFTQEVLHNIGVDNTQIIGCPTYYEMGKDRCIIKHEWHDSMRLGCSSINLCLDIPNTYIYLQDSEESDLIRYIAYSANGIVSRRIYKMIETKALRIFSSIDLWKRDISSREFFYGYRMHGGMVALNSGVPVVVLNKDSRAREMCEFMNIPYFAGYKVRNRTDLYNLYQKCDYSKMNNEYVDKFEEYKLFLSQNNLVYAPISDNDVTIELPIYQNLQISEEALLCYLRRVLPLLPKKIKGKIKYICKEILKD